MLPLPFASVVAVAGSALTAAIPEFSPASAMFSARLTWRSRPNEFSFEVVSRAIEMVVIVRTPITTRARTSAMPSSRASRLRSRADHAYSSSRTSCLAITREG